MPPDDQGHDYLKRLDRSAYRGAAYVHWTHTIAHRRQGWLTDSFHAQFRELLVHTCFRYDVWIPAYCLMPDHLHLLILGASPLSDQRNSTRFLRKQVNRLLLPGFKLQDQAHDHVLQEKETERFAFERTASYIFDNPRRAGLITEASDWPCAGSTLPGHPEISRASGEEKFWDDFWRLYFKAIDRNFSDQQAK